MFNLQESLDAHKKALQEICSEAQKSGGSLNPKLKYSDNPGIVIGFHGCDRITFRLLGFFENEKLLILNHAFVKKNTITKN